MSSSPVVLLSSSLASQSPRKISAAWHPQSPLGELGCRRQLGRNPEQPRPVEHLLGLDNGCFYGAPQGAPGSASGRPAGGAGTLRWGERETGSHRGSGQGNSYWKGRLLPGVLPGLSHTRCLGSWHSCLLGGTLWPDSRKEGRTGVGQAENMLGLGLSRPCTGPVRGRAPPESSRVPFSWPSGDPGGFPALTSGRVTFCRMQITSLLSA